jgi:hypothetical protein
MRFIRVLMLFGAALLLPGCLPPMTSHPVGTTAGIVNDPALTGLWRARMQNSGDDPDVYFHFLPKDDGTITVVMVQGGSNVNSDWSVASITTAKVGSNHILNAKLTFSDDKPVADDSTDTTPLLYRSDRKGHLLLSLMDEDATKDAIQSGAIKGLVEQGQYGDVKITADPKSLDAFMGSARGAALFSAHFATLTKIE